MAPETRTTLWRREPPCTGEEFTFVGGTMAVSADGDILVETSAAAEEVLEFELELPARSSVRPDYLSQLRSPFPTTRDVSAISQ